jgi:F-box/TPR repeat protein Pof3
MAKSLQKLQSLYNKLRQAQDPGKSLDPLQFLPLELAQMVIENLGMRDRV